MEGKGCILSGWERLGNQADFVRKSIKEEADREVRIAEKRNGDFTIHDENRVIRDSDNFGNDPSSIKDTKH